MKYRIQTHSPKVICHLITGLGRGGAETMLYKLLSHMRCDAFQNIVISMTDEGVFGAKIKQRNIPVHCLKIKKDLRLFKAMTTYRKLIKHYRPHIIQTWMYHANAFALLNRAFLPSHKIVFNIRQSLAAKQKEKKLTQAMIKLNAWTSHYADKVINNSKASQAQHKKIAFCRTNGVYIGNGFDADAFQPNKTLYLKFRKQYGLSSNTRLIGMLARYHPIKNHLGFLEVAAQILEHHSQDIRFVLAGRGCDNQNQALTEHIQQLQLTHQVILLGEVNSALVLPALDVYLSTSLNEGFPNVIGEALLSEVPCVTTDVGDCREIIADYGTVAKVGDDRALSEACLHWLKAPPSTEKKNQMRAYMIQHYSIEAITEQYETLYHSLLQG